jgi:hypothetical protein
VYAHAVPEKPKANVHTSNMCCCVNPSCETLYLPQLFLMDLSALSGSLSENIVRNDSSGTTLFVLKDACIIPLQQSDLPDNAQYRRTRHLTIQTAGLSNALTTVLIHAFLHRRIHTIFRYRPSNISPCRRICVLDKDARSRHILREENGRHDVFRKNLLRGMHAVRNLRRGRILPLPCTRFGGGM